MLVGRFPDGRIEYFTEEGAFNTSGMDLVFQYKPRYCEIDVLKDRYNVVPCRSVFGRKKVAKFLLKYA